MKATQANIYDFPKYYDLIFGSDWKAEVAFLQACFQLHSRRNVHRLFEPACGTGRLVYRLAKAGYEVVGLDINQAAVDFCNQRLRRHQLPPSAIVGDMTAFTLKKKADAAFNTINSFRHLATESQARDHLRCVGSALKKGGLYILGFHLTPTLGDATEEESWSARRGHLQVNTHMWLLQRNLRRRQELYGMRYDVYTPSGAQRIEDEILFRTYTAKQFEKLLQSVDMFDVAAVYDFAYDTSEPIELLPDTEDAVFVLRKR